MRLSVMNHSYEQVFRTLIMFECRMFTYIRTLQKYIIKCSNIIYNTTLHVKYTAHNQLTELKEDEIEQDVYK